MRYFVLKDKENFSSGAKVRVLIRNYDFETQEYSEEILEEFTLEKFEYYPEKKILVIYSPANFSEEELKEKIGSGDVILEIENVT